MRCCYVVSSGLWRSVGGREAVGGRWGGGREGREISSDDRDGNCLVVVVVVVVLMVLVWETICGAREIDCGVLVMVM